MSLRSWVAWPGAPFGIASAALFGASTPLAKALLGEGVNPWLLASLLYLGSGLGLAFVWVLRRRVSNEAPLVRGDWGWMALVVLAGGVAGPLLLMLGLTTTPASSAALLLNLEGLATMGIAWAVFRENVDRRLLLGALAILAGAALLAWQGTGSGFGLGAVAIAGACLAWGIDNNLTRGKGTKLTLTAGRMTLNLGSRRLVAADDYRNTTNGYTGLRADIAAPQGWKTTLIYTLPQVRLPDDTQGIRDAKVRLDRESFDLVLWGGQVSKAKAIGAAMAELSYFHLGERDVPGRPTRDRSLDTFGGRIIAEPRASKFDYEIEAFYQTGHVSASPAPTAARQSVGASFIHADVGYSFAGPWKPRLSVEFDRASGDKPGGRFGRFDTLFGMRRADLAPAGLYNAIARTNIMTPGIRIEATPSKRLDWFASYRPMWLAADQDSFSSTSVRDASGRSGDFAGHQIEARIRYWLVPTRLRFELDGLLLAKGRFLRDAPNAPPGEWTRYGSFNLTASF